MAVLIFKTLADALETSSYTWGNDSWFNIITMQNAMLISQEKNFVDVCTTADDCAFSLTTDCTSNYWKNTDGTKVYTIR